MIGDLVRDVFRSDTWTVISPVVDGYVNIQDIGGVRRVCQAHVTSLRLTAIARLRRRARRPS